METLPQNAKKETQQLDLETLSDMDLVNLVNETEGLSWRINHDAADGRISNEGVGNSISELGQIRDKAVEIIKKRTFLLAANYKRLFFLFVCICKETISIKGNILY